MPRSLKLSPAAMVSKPQDCRAFTVVSLDWGQRIRKPVISPLGATSRELQRMVGQPSLRIRGMAHFLRKKRILCLTNGKVQGTINT